MSRATAEIEPVSRMLSSSLALRGPIRAPDSNRIDSVLPSRRYRQSARGRHPRGSCEPDRARPVDEPETVEASVAAQPDGPAFCAAAAVGSTG